MKLAGGLIADVDSMANEFRSTGAKQSDFTGIMPRYIRLSIDPINVKNWVVPAAIEGSIQGVQSGLILKWGICVIGAGVVDTVFEWLPPIDFPVLFDEDVEVTINTETGATVVMDYIMYYDIVQSTELEMVKTIAGY